MMPTPAENKHLSVHFPLIGRVFSIFGEKKGCLIREEWTSKCLVPRRNSKQLYNQINKRFSVI